MSAPIYLYTGPEAGERKEAVEKIKKTKEKYIPNFTDNFKKAGIVFETVNLITPDILSEQAKEMIKNASFVMLMGGDKFKKKELCGIL